jgi:quercetin dioxygenase-like cupin family protein
MEIAPRLRGLREACGFSIEEMAALTHVTPQDVKTYESAEHEIPVSFLKDVAHACKVDLTVLISGSEAHLRGYTVVRKGEGLSVKRRKDYDYWSLASRLIGRTMEPFIVRVPPKEEKELIFTTHQGQEFIYMLEGRLEIWLDQKREILKPGDSLYFNSTIAHALRGLAGTDAVFLDIIS